MTKRTPEPNRVQRSIAVEEPDNSQNRVLLDQHPSNCGIVEIDLAVLNRVDGRRREGIRVNFQTERQGVSGCERVDRLMKLELAAPECLVAKSVESKDLFSLCDHCRPN